MRIPTLAALALLLAAPATRAPAVPFSGVLSLSLGQVFAQIPGSGEGVSTPSRVAITSGGFSPAAADQGDSAL